MSLVLTIPRACQAHSLWWTHTCIHIKGCANLCLNLNVDVNFQEESWDGGSIFECSHNCSCSLQECGSCVTQQPMNLAMHVERSNKVCLATRDQDHAVNKSFEPSMAVNVVSFLPASQQHGPEGAAQIVDGPCWCHVKSSAP